MIVLLYRSVVEGLEDFVESGKITRPHLENAYESISALAELGYDFFEENDEYIEVIQQCEEHIMQQESSDAIERVFSPIVEDIIHANLIHLSALTV
jgi:Holliday junction resolvasome RuvABC DNA-binding subunit